VLDECQAAGSSNTREAQLARMIRADHVLLLSGAVQPTNGREDIACLLFISVSSKIR
jgi:hypothetical protein